MFTAEHRDAVRAEWAAQASPRYSPAAHFATTSAGLCLIAAGAVAMMRAPRVWQLLLLPAVWIFANAFEWHLHRGVLHHKVRGLEKVYRRHTPLHHTVFVADDMAIRGAAEIRMVMFPPQVAFAMVGATFPVPLALALAGERNLACLWVAGAAGYVLAYEWLHLAAHLPVSTRIGGSRLVRRLARHHTAHHDPERMSRWNFNVFLPLWDLRHGTIWRAPAGR